MTVTELLWIYLLVLGAPFIVYIWKDHQATKAQAKHWKQLGEAYDDVHKLMHSNIRLGKALEMIASSDMDQAAIAREAIKKENQRNADAH